LLKVSTFVSRHQAGLDPVELGAGIAQAGHLDRRRVAQLQARARR
jgi:hypothetical protein